MPVNLIESGDLLLRGQRRRDARNRLCTGGVQRHIPEVVRFPEKAEVQKGRCGDFDAIQLRARVAEHAEVILVAVRHTAQHGQRVLAAGHPVDLEIRSGNVEKRRLVGIEHGRGVGVI